MDVKREFLIDRQGKTAVLYAGVLDLAHQRGLTGIRTTLLQVPADENGQVAIVSAVAEFTDGRSFSGLGDASPLNVARPMLTCLIRMAECVPLNTRILTATGWKFHHELTVGELVLAYDVDADCCRWTPLRHVSVYGGQWEAIRLSSRSFEAVCTPDHTWAVTSQNGPRRLKRTCDLTPSDRIITSAPCLDGSHPLTAEESAILGWLATDGTVRSSYVGQYGPYRRMVIRQSKPDQVERIRELVGVNASEYVSQPRDRDFGSHVSKCLPCHTFDLRAEFGRNLWQKAGLRDWSDLPQLALQLGPEAREAMLASMLDGDGSRRGNRDSWTFGKKRKPGVMSAFRLLATLNGRSLGKPGMASRGDVPVQTIRANRLISCDYLKRDRVIIDGVWCPTTDLGTWIMERNGHITITGNTRSKARALRDAVNLGALIAEELPDDVADETPQPRRAASAGRQSPRSQELAQSSPPPTTAPTQVDPNKPATEAQRRAVILLLGGGDAAVTALKTRYGVDLADLTDGVARRVIRERQVS